MKKKIIRLTENDIHTMIHECLKTYINEYSATTRSGYVPSDGNHMVGGKWSATSGIQADYTFDILEQFSEFANSNNIDEERAENFDEYFANQYGDSSVTANAVFEYEYDESVGVAPHYEFEEGPELDSQVIEIIEQTPEEILSREEIDTFLDYIDEYLKSVDVDDKWGWHLYE